MQKSRQASGSLKNIAEEEWCFAKEICPFIKGAEARAGFKFWYVTFYYSCDWFL